MVQYPPFARFEDAFEEIKKAESVLAAVFILRDRYELANITYHLAQTIQGNVDAPYVRTTYPDAWVARYLLKDYVKVDRYEDLHGWVLKGYRLRMSNPDSVNHRAPSLIAPGSIRPA